MIKMKKNIDKHTNQYNTMNDDDNNGTDDNTENNLLITTQQYINDNLHEMANSTLSNESSQNTMPNQNQREVYQKLFGKSKKIFRNFGKNKKIY